MNKQTKDVKYETKVERYRGSVSKSNICVTGVLEKNVENTITREREGENLEPIKWADKD